MELNIIDRIISDFRKAGFNTEASRLKGFKEKLLSNNHLDKKEGMDGIIGFCHVRAWGDLNMAGKCDSYRSNQDWINTLEKLKKVVKNSCR